MADAFAEVAAVAVATGWHPEEVSAALVELVDNHMLAVLANRDVERELFALTGS
jgi:activator of 2-hydroxyglutaryl-CoA dehydratase